MCGIIGSVVTLSVGSALVILSCVLGYVLVPNLINKVITSEVVLKDNTIQMERFQEVPFALNFSVNIFELTNPEQVLNGSVPVMVERGPYIYKLYQTRELVDSNADTVYYRRHEHFVFDPVLSFPRKEEDLVTIINVPYHAIIQVAETLYPRLMSVISLVMDDVFGKYNEPLMTVSIRELLFSGIPLCQNPGEAGALACGIIRNIAKDAQNIQELEDGSLVFSILDYKEQLPSKVYEVSRGLDDAADLGRIIRYGGSRYFDEWPNEVGSISTCNMIYGTDSGIFAPFIERSQNLYAINTDICRSVELRYELDTEYEGIPAVRYAANEWLLDNNEGCYCLNFTSGINREDGCLLKGAMELYSCVGAFLVLSYPHFLFADILYRDSVIGMRPDEEKHKIFMDIEPYTGTPIRAAKRAQFNIFSRPVKDISTTEKLRTALMPILWIDETINLPAEFVEELTDKLLKSLKLVDIFIPIIITICCVVFVLGVYLTIRARLRKGKDTPKQSD